MADNCFQVWHCSVNEFVLFCGRLTVSFLPFISLSFSHTHTHFLIFFSLPLFSCYLASIFTLSLALSTPSLSLSLLSIFLFSFYIFALLVIPFLCFVCSRSANNRGILYFPACCSQQIVYLDFSSLILLHSPPRYQCSTTIEDSHENH